MDAGKLNKRVQLYQPRDVPDGQGGRRRELVQKYELWGSMTVPRATIREVQGNPGVEVTYDLVLRRISENVVGWQLRCGDGVYIVIAQYPGYDNATVLRLRRHQGRA